MDYVINESIKVYPNPVKNVLNLDVPLSVVQSSYQIYNSMGLLMKTGVVLNEKMTLELGGIPAGSYFLMIENSGQAIRFVALK